MHAQIFDQPPSPHELNPNIRASVSEVVMRMLSKGVELRPHTGAEFVRALQVAAEGSVPIRPLSKGKVETRPIQVQEKKPFWNSLVFWALLLTPVVGCALAGGFWAINRWADLSNMPTATMAAAQNPVVIGGTPGVDGPTLVPTFTATPNIPTPTMPLPTGTLTPTPLPIPAAITLPGTPIIAENSPFTNLILAGSISDDSQPQGVGTVFPPSEEPIYLFYDYNFMQPGATWGAEWRWDDVTLQKTEDVWPQDYGSAGTAWVYFAPPFGFQPGPYSVDLVVDGKVVASANFIVQAQ